MLYLKNFFVEINKLKKIKDVNAKVLINSTVYLDIWIGDGTFKMVHLRSHTLKRIQQIFKQMY